MLNLIQNENMKIYRRVRTWILLLLIVGIAATASVISSNTKGGPGKTASGSWQAQLQTSIDQDQRTIDSPGLPAGVKDQLERTMMVKKYRIEHNIAPTDGSLWSNVMLMSGVISFVTIFTVIIAADIVAGEFSAGTIKLLLIRPASRSKILLSKYIATLEFAMLLLLVLFAASFIMGGLLYGFRGVGEPYLYASKDMHVHEDSMLLHALSTYGLKCVELIMVVTLAFMISTVFRSSSLAIGISLLIMFVGGGIVTLLRQYAWIKYYLFANTDLTQYIEGKPVVEGMTLPFSIAVLAVYFIVFNALSWGIFSKRDVAA